MLENKFQFESKCAYYLEWASEDQGVAWGVEELARPRHQWVEKWIIEWWNSIQSQHYQEWSQII